jgi:transposase-like protein
MLITHRVVPLARHHSKVVVATSFLGNLRQHGRGRPFVLVVACSVWRSSWVQKEESVTHY